MELESCKHVLVFGGSFDPPHRAHVVLPRAAMAAVGADAVAYVPTGVQPFKQQGQTAAHHRLAMLRLAVEGQLWAVVLTDEIERSDAEPTYTVDTLEALRARLGPGVRLSLLIGGDNLRAFDRWMKPRRVIALAEPVVMVRPPDTREELLACLPAGYEAQEWAGRLVDVPLIDVSSTQVRRLVAQGGAIDGLVDPAVEAYIRQHGLYEAERPRV